MIDNVLIKTKTYEPIRFLKIKSLMSFLTTRFRRQQTVGPSILGIILLLELIEYWWFIFSLIISFGNFQMKTEYKALTTKPDRSNIPLAIIV